MEPTIPLFRFPTRTAALLAACVCAACTIVTVPPQAPPPPAAFRQAAPEADEAELTQWWRHFADPVLEEIVAKVRRDNLDLEAALARLAQARAQRRATAADLGPTITGSGSAARNRTSAETGMGTIENQFQVGFDAQWELDVFGGRRAALRAAEAQQTAATYDLADVLVSTTAEAAQSWFDARTAQARLTLLDAQLVVLERSLALAQAKAAAGLVSELDVRQAQTLLAQTRAQRAALAQGRESALNALALLAGEAPGYWHERLTRDQPPGPPPAAAGAEPPELAYLAPWVTRLPPLPAAGIPADVLRRRPDVRRSEAQLAAAAAQRDVADAARYPSFPLSGSLGLTALTAGDLWQASARTWSLAFAPLATLFDGGKLSAQLEASEAQLMQSFADYRKSVLSALSEVENALLTLQEDDRRLDDLRQAADSARASVELALAQYRSGLTDYTVLIDTQRTWLSATDAFVAQQGQNAGDRVRLYKALGGGWPGEAPQEETVR